MADQPLFFARLAELMEAMGDDSPAFGTLERSVVPVMVVGDGTEVVPPLYAPRSFSGGNLAGGGTASTHAMFQINATNPGGLRSLTRIGSDAAADVRFALMATPPTMVSVFPGANNIQVQPGANFTFEIGLGTATQVTGSAFMRVPQDGESTVSVIIPNGITLVVALSVNTAKIFVAADIVNLTVDARL